MALSHKSDTQSLYISSWNIISGLAYIAVLIYSFVKRDKLSQEKIRFFVYSGFFIFWFVNYVGCMTLGKILK